jgi:hypothetical protein
MALLILPKWFKTQEESRAASFTPISKTIREREAIARTASCPRGTPMPSGVRLVLYSPQGEDYHFGSTADRASSRFLASTASPLFGYFRTISRQAQPS